MAHEGIQRQLGHSHLSTTGTDLQGISSEEIISTVKARRAPMMHASAGLALWSTTMRERMMLSRDPANRPPRPGRSLRASAAASRHWPRRGKPELRDGRRG